MRFLQCYQITQSIYHFDTIAKKNFEWFQKLNSLNYEFSEMTEILVNDIIISS